MSRTISATPPASSATTSSPRSGTSARSTSDPKHVRTWQYYGMWHVEQGNMLKAADFLEKIEAICGNKACKEYQDLKGGMEGTVTY